MRVQEAISVRACWLVSGVAFDLLFLHANAHEAAITVTRAARTVIVAGRNWASSFSWSGGSTTPPTEPDWTTATANEATCERVPLVPTIVRLKFPGGSPGQVRL